MNSRYLSSAVALNREMRRLLAEIKLLRNFVLRSSRASVERFFASSSYDLAKGITVLSSIASMNSSEGV